MPSRAPHALSLTMKQLLLSLHTSTVADGNMALRFGDADTVRNNRAHFFVQAGVLDTKIALMEVSHGAVVRDVSLDLFHAQQELSLETEAVITREANITLFLLTADCIPVVVFDSVQGVLALAHLGWRPTVLGLMEKTITHMEQVYGSNPQNLSVYLGPSIQAASYAFSEVTQDDPRWTPYLLRGEDGMVHVDLPGYVKSECLRLGLSKEAVHVSSVDTAKDEQYFSHMRSKRTGSTEGRFATIATLRYANEA